MIKPITTIRWYLMLYTYLADTTNARIFYHRKIYHYSLQVKFKIILKFLFSQWFDFYQNRSTNLSYCNGNNVEIGMSIMIVLDQLIMTMKCIWRVIHHLQFSWGVWKINLSNCFCITVVLLDCIECHIYKLIYLFFIFFFLHLAPKK